MVKKTVLSLLLFPLLLAGCISEIPPASPPAPPQEITGYELIDAKTAVLTSESTLSGCYSYTLKEGYGTSGTDDPQSYQWITLESEHTLSQGDIVAVLEEKDGVARVVIPYGDLPWLYGYLPSDLLSREQGEIEGGNQAMLHGCETYDAPNGTPLSLEYARVKILDRENEWAKVQAYGTGADPYWVHTSDLSFDFDASLSDRPQ